MPTAELDQQIKEEIDRRMLNDQDFVNRLSQGDLGEYADNYDTRTYVLEAFAYYAIFYL